MPEGAHPYPKWTGALSTLPAFPIVTMWELRRAWNNQWVRFVVTLVLLFGVIHVASFSLRGQASMGGAHSLDLFLTFLNLFPWGAIAIAAVVGAPMFLEDSRLSALELYLSRGVNRWEYLLGKSLAVFLLTAGVIYAPVLMYYGTAWLVFDNHPEFWNWVPLSSLLYVVMWALMVSGLSLGVSCVSRSSRAATLIVLGAFVLLDKIVGGILEFITAKGALRILSPYAAMVEQQTWLFKQEGPFQFPYVWGLALWAGLTTLGWALVAWRHPRLKGVS